MSKKKTRKSRVSFSHVSVATNDRFLPRNTQHPKSVVGDVFPPSPSRHSKSARFANSGREYKYFSFTRELGFSRSGFCHLHFHDQCCTPLHPFVGVGNALWVLGGNYRKSATNPIVVMALGILGVRALGKSDLMETRCAK